MGEDTEQTQIWSDKVTTQFYSAVTDWLIN